MARKQPEPAKPRRASGDAPSPENADERLDEALDESFPASDPPSIVQPDDGPDGRLAEDEADHKPQRGRRT